jgi:hypothetical protein
MKRCLPLCLLLVALTTFGQAAKEKPFPACFPADTLVVFRIDAAQLMDQRLFQDVLGAKLGGMDAFFQQVQGWTGVNLNTLTEAWVAVQKKDHVVMVLKGEFDTQLIQSTVLNIDAAQVVQRPGVPFAVTLPDDKKPGQFNLAALLDKKTLVFGKPDLVDSFLACLKGNGKGLPPEVAARAAALMGSKRLLDVLLTSIPASEMRKNPWLSLIAHVQGAASITDTDLVLQAKIGLVKPEMREPATKAIEGVRDIYGMLDDNLRKLGPLKGMLLEGITVKPDEKDLFLELAVPMDVAERLVRQKFNLP